MLGDHVHLHLAALQDGAVVNQQHADLLVRQARPTRGEQERGDLLVVDVGLGAVAGPRRLLADDAAGVRDSSTSSSAQKKAMPTFLGLLLIWNRADFWARDKAALLVVERQADGVADAVAMLPAMVARAAARGRRRREQDGRGVLPRDTLGSVGFIGRAGHNGPHPGYYTWAVG